MEPERFCIHGRLTSERKPHTRCGSDQPKHTHHHTHQHQITTTMTHTKQSRTSSRSGRPQIRKYRRSPKYTHRQLILHQHNQNKPLHNKPNILQPSPTQIPTPTIRPSIDNKGLKTTPNTHRQGQVSHGHIII